MTTASIETLSSPAPVRPGRFARRRRGLARRVAARALGRVAFTFEGGAAQDPAKSPASPRCSPGSSTRARAPTTPMRSRSGWRRAPSNSSFNAGHDAVGGSLKTLVKHADEAFELLRLALAEPRFDPDAVERVRAQTIAGLRYQAERSQRDGHRALLRRGVPGSSLWAADWRHGESVAAITRDDLLRLHRAVVARGRVKMAVVGAIGPDRLCDLVDDVFASLPEPEALTPVPPTTVAGRGSRVVVDLDVPQSVIRFGLDGVTWRDPDFIGGLRAQPHARRRRVHLAPVPGGAREARPRLQRRHLARELSRRAP